MPGATCCAVVTFVFGKLSAAMDSQVAAATTAAVHRVLIATNAVRSVRRVIDLRDLRGLRDVLLTYEICCLVDAAAALVARHLRIRAQRTRAIDFPVCVACDAGIMSGALPFSTHCSSAVSSSKSFGPSPPPQCAMPGAMNNRYDA